MVDLGGVVPLLICLIHFDNLLWRVLLECVSLMLPMLLVSFLTSFVRAGVLNILYLLNQTDYIEFGRIVKISYLYFSYYFVYEIFTLYIYHRF